jgi:y4mF family transcriptional regulator
MESLSAFIKYQRKKLGFTQEDLATKAGVGLRFVREMEQGKETLQMDKVAQVLALTGFELVPAKQHLDAYYVYWHYLNKAVKITLANRTVKHGILLQELIDKNESKITAWRFLPGNHAIKNNLKKDDSLTEVITHKDIEAIEEE